MEFPLCSMLQESKSGTKSRLKEKVNSDHFNVHQIASGATDEKTGKEHINSSQ